VFLLGDAGRHSRPAIVTAARTVTYGELRHLIGETGRLLRSDRKLLVTVFGDRDLGTVLAYLAALSERHACALHDPAATAAQQLAHLDAYRPDVVVYGPDANQVDPPEGYRPAGRLPEGGAVFRRTAEDGAVLRHAAEGGVDIDDRTALLLTTSGSTGSPQTVRLSRDNLSSNARAIGAALGITEADRGITALPLHYCYGLSVLNSHLAAGGSVVLCGESPVSARLWHLMSTLECTNLAGVPTTYRLLHARGVDVGAVPSLRMLTQAGGKLEDDLIRHFADMMARSAGQFVVMYGQTEATARIACLPHGELGRHPGSVGRPVPGGRVWIRGEDEHTGVALPDGTVGRVMYEGPNVMLGYARCRADLSQGDTLHGVLDTGDRGCLRDGMLYLTGRAKRIVKVYGRRMDLDDIEAVLRCAGPAAVVSTGDERIAIVTEGDRAAMEPVRERLARELKVPRHTIELVRVEALPYTASGKVDYVRLGELVVTDA
jgi:acyl-CoA synthetase (AMP-forming)/AMP-acid ligase II